jgi:hypothetical protein
MTLPIYELKISDNLQDEAMVDYIALVDAPAIKKDFVAFKNEFIEPSKGEHESDFLQRCIKYVIDEGKESEQAVAICNSLWEQHFAGVKISIDYDDTLSTDKGKELAKRLIADGEIVYIISARNDVDGMLGVAESLGIPKSRVYATGSNNAKVQKIKDLGIEKHYDNNADVIKELGTIGSKFMQFESYTDYPKEASENAKIALRWAEQNGWGECGTAVGKIRANQLANNEPISRDTISRMASFERHRQNSQKELGDGCGRLMWLAWGGDAGIEWASRKLQQIDRNNFSIISEEKRIISGALMLADELIFRDNERFGQHYVKFSAETIKSIAIKWAKKNFNNHVNLMHDPEQKVKGVTMFESWLVDSNRGIMPMKGFEGVADGSWFGSFYVENEKVWQSIKRGDYKGFSVEGLFDYEQPISPEENALKKISELLNSIIED